MELQSLGATVTFSRGPDAYDFDQGVVRTLSPVEITREENTFTVMVQEQIVALESIGAIRNVTRLLGSGVPELNSPAARNLASDKYASNQMFGRAGIEKSFSLWTPGSDIDSIIDSFSMDDLVAKPQRGARSRGVTFGTKKEIAAYLESFDTETEGMIIEERIDTRGAMDVRGLTQKDTDLIERANRDRIPKELRAFTFGREAGEMQVYYLLRVAKNGGEDFKDVSWVYLDQTSIGDEVRQLVDVISTEFQHSSGAQEIHSAIDFVAVPTDSGSKLIPMEINATEPHLVLAEYNPDISKLQTTMLAKQLIRVAHSDHNVYSKDI
jgi:hypothetical protein